LRTLNLGILAHVDAGKTTLTERLLFEAGVLDEPGSVDAGSTHTDTMAIERRRGITIRAAVVSFEVAGVRVNLVDTPGHSDFVAEVERSLGLLDGAVLVVSAVEGVQAQSLVLMRALQRLGVATVVFVNKVDRMGADPEFVELEVRERLDADVPVLSGSALTGVGVAELLGALPTLLPARQPEQEGPATGEVFKIDRDASGGKEVVALLRSGTLGVRDRVDLGHGRSERVTGLRVFNRGGTELADRAEAGQVVVLRGVDSAAIGDVFGPGSNHHSVQFARPSLATVVEPLDVADRPALHAALVRLAEQDPLIALRQDDERRELHLSLYGEVQQQVIGSLLAEEYGVDVRFRDTAMICVERVLGTGAAYERIGTPTNPYLATVGLRVEPAPVGSGIDFGLEVELGSMPPAFFAAVESAVAATLRQGPHGWEIPDARVRMTHSGYYARQSHAHGTFDKSMSSTAGDFRYLASLMLGTALARAGTSVCTPVHRFELEVPASTLGAVLSLLASVGAVPLTTEPGTASVVLTGDVPADAVHRLTLQVPGVTRGEGALTTRLDHYRPVTGRPPRRPHVGADPYDREEYLRRVTR
jgi:ribosomal protection tetracycline resistance protein